MQKSGFEARGEPLIEDILADPIVQKLMKSDGLTADAVRHFIQGQRIRILENRMANRMLGEAA